MPDIIRERMTAQMEGDFCVFLIGMRVNQLWKVTSGCRWRAPWAA